MQLAEKLLLIAGVGREVYGKWRLQRILSTLIALLMLGMMTAVMMSALLIGSLYAACLFFLSQGITQADAVCITALIALFFIASLLMLMRRCLRKLKSSARTPMGEAANAFFDGLFAE